jgi:hypothetical protein
MIIDRGLVDARLGDDGPDTGAVIAALGEQSLGRFDDPLARDLGGSRHA